MKYTVLIAPQAMQDLERLRAHDRRTILDLSARTLATEPTRVTRSRIKRLREMETPQYRLRVGDYRVLYDVAGAQVQVLRVLSKARVDEYLREMGYESKDG